MVDDAMVRLATAQYGLFSRQQALDMGATAQLIARRIRAGRWVALTAGVYSLPGVPDAWRRSLMAACLEAGPDAVVSHESAAALHGLATFLPGRLVVMLPHGDHQYLRLGMLRQTTDLSSHHSTRMENLTVTTPARTVVDLAGTLRPGRLRVVVEDAVAAGSCSLPQLSSLVEELSRPGKRGLRQLSLILAAVGPGIVPAPTTLERRLRRILREGGLPSPVREHELPWTRDTPGRVDFAYPAQRVIVEADSRRWHTRERDFEADRRRDREAQLAGWDVYRFTWDDLQHRPDDVVATVRRALAVSRK
jgi:very-short-patch-repair endonuclease